MSMHDVAWTIVTVRTYDITSWALCKDPISRTALHDVIWSAEKYFTGSNFLYTA